MYIDFEKLTEFIYPERGGYPAEAGAGAPGLENPRFLNSHERVGSRLSSHDGSRGTSVNPPDVTSKDRFLSSRQRYQRIVNKASCLSLVSNAILYWNTIKIAETMGRLRAQGEDISDETLSHVSLLPFRHVLPNGTYFIENS